MFFKLRDDFTSKIPIGKNITVNWLNFSINQLRKIEEKRLMSVLHIFLGLIINYLCNDDFTTKASVGDIIVKWLSWPITQLRVI